MPTPLSVRTRTPAERQHLQASLRAAEAFTVRRAQILLSSANCLRPSQLARNLGCGVVTVRNALHAFQRGWLACLQEKSSRPHSAHALLDERFAEPLKDLLHRSPRLYGPPTSPYPSEVSGLGGIVNSCG